MGRSADGAPRSSRTRPNRRVWSATCASRSAGNGFAAAEVSGRRAASSGSPAFAAGGLVEPVEARAGGDEQDGLVGPSHLEPPLRRRASRSSPHDGPHDCGEAHALGAGSFVVADRVLRVAEVARVDVARRAAPEGDTVRAFGRRRVPQTAGHPRGEGHPPGAIRAHAEDDDLVGEAREDLAGVESAAGAERRGRDRPIEVELATVALDGTATSKSMSRSPSGW